MAKLTKDYFGSADEGEGIRINKYLSDAGICSRREADALIAKGQVCIDGIPAVMGSKVAPGQKVTVSGKEALKEERLVLIAFNKPQGIVCTADRREPDNIVDFINYGSRIFPIGRLDKDSEGLILLTNNGEIVNKILRAGNEHEKEYIVQVNKPLTAEFLKGMAGGVPILDTVTKPCLVEQIDKMTFRIVLTQGLNRQIRRMCEYFDYRVRALKRVRVMNVNLGRLKTGTWRNLTEWELEELNGMLKASSNAPAAENGAEAAKTSMPPEGVVILKKTAGKGAGTKNFKPEKEDGKKREEWRKKEDRQKTEDRGKRENRQKNADRQKGVTQNKVGAKPFRRIAKDSYDKAAGDSYGKLARDSHDKIAGDFNGKLAGDSFNKAARASYNKIARDSHDKERKPYDKTVKDSYNKIAGEAYDKAARNSYDKTPRDSYHKTAGNSHNKSAERITKSGKSTRPKTEIKGAGWTTKKQGTYQKRRTGKK